MRDCSDCRSVIKSRISIVEFGLLMDGLINHVSCTPIKQVLNNKDTMRVMVHSHPHSDPGVIDRAGICVCFSVCYLTYMLQNVYVQFDTITLQTSSGHT